MKEVKFVFDRKKSAAQMGVGKIEIRVYLGKGERKFITVGTATPDTWELVVLRSDIIKRAKHYEEVINAMRTIGEEMTIENFDRHTYYEDHPQKRNKSHLYNGHDQHQNFVEFCRDYMEKENLRPNSIKGINVVLDAVEESGIIKTFADLIPAKIRAFDLWLHKQNNKTDYTIYGYHKKIHKYMRILWQDQMIPSDPYNYVRINHGSNKERRPLTEEEIIRIRDTKYIGRLERVRDLFIFMAYTGLSYCDMACFDFDKMTVLREKFHYIDGTRLKTGSCYYTPILPPAMNVLKKYDYKLPVISNQKINDYLHIIQTELKIDKEMTCHVARHSFATLMISYGVPMETTQRMLGHRDIKTTQSYAKVTDRNVEECAKKISKRIR